MVSGGVDSQAMLYAWYKSGVPFTAIMRVMIQINPVKFQYIVSVI